MTPQLLIIGHIVKDIQPDGWCAGGGALYAAAQATKLGVETVVVTACETEIEPADMVAGAAWYVRRMNRGIEFENTYTNGSRVQRVLSNSAPLTLDDVPKPWRSAQAILLTPVFHDVAPELPGQLVKHGTFVGLGAQGWLRKLDGDRVIVSAVEPAPAWLVGDVVFVSEEDVADPEAVAQWQRRVPVVVLTRGKQGYTVWHDGGREDMAAVPGSEHDPTGAGDVFATAYLVRYMETQDPLESARFAAVAAAISVEASGIESVASRTEIEARLQAVKVTR